MTRAVSRIEPILLPKIWGGVRLGGAQAAPPGDRIGEMLAFHPQCVLAGEGRTVADLQAESPQLYGSPDDALCVTLIDAAEPLSLQVHPCGLAGEVPRPEAWVVIESAPGAQMEFGHRAPSREALARSVVHGQWGALTAYYPLEAGDALFVPAGTCHAIGAGLFIYETSFAGTPTYRLYDYDRLDASGRPRPLDVEASLANVLVPSPEPHIQHAGESMTRIAERGFFPLSDLRVEGEVLVADPDAYVFTCVAGLGSLDGAALAAGDTVLVHPGNEPLHLAGSMWVLAAGLIPLG